VSGYFVWVIIQKYVKIRVGHATNKSTLRMFGAEDENGCYFSEVKDRNLKIDTVTV